MRSCIAVTIRLGLYVLFLSLALTTRSQQLSALPKELRGNWFLQEDNNQWVIGLYDKLAYFNNKFWSYKLVTLKQNEITILLQDGRSRDTVRLTVQNDSLITANHQKTYRVLVNKPRYMASGSQIVPLPSQRIPDSVLITGYLDHRSLTQEKNMQFRVHNLLTGSAISQTATVGKNGRFTIGLPFEYPHSPVTLDFGGLFETLYLQPGDTAFLYMDLFPYTKATTAADIPAIDCNLIMGGASSGFNNEYRHYHRWLMSWDDRKRALERVKTSDPHTYMSYEMGRKRLQDSLQAAYRTQYTMSKALWARAQQENGYRLLNALYRYPWLHENGKTTSLPADYTKLLDALTIENSQAYLAGFEWEGVVREVLNRQVTNHLSNRNKIDSFITARSSLESVLNYVQQYDLSLPDSLAESIDLLKKSVLTLTVRSGGYSLQIPEKDSATSEAVIRQFAPLLKHLGSTDHPIYYYSGMELLWGLSRIDSLFPRGFLRDHLIGRYLYTYFMEGNRLNLQDDFFSKAQPLLSDPANYTVLEQVRSRLKKQFDMETYESLVSENQADQQQTVLNSIARRNKGKVLFIDIWATWCGSCLEQFSYSNSLKKQFVNKPVEFVYLCIESEKKAWQSDIKKYGLSGQNLLLTTNEIAALRSKYQFTGIPRYMIINSDGRLFTSNSIYPENKAALQKTLENLLN